MAIKKLDVVTQVCPFPLIEAKAAQAVDYAEQQRWLEHRRQVFTPEFLQGYADELQMLAQQYADNKEKVALLKALWQYAEEIV